MPTPFLALFSAKKTLVAQIHRTIYNILPPPPDGLTPDSLPSLPKSVQTDGVPTRDFSRMFLTHGAPFALVSRKRELRYEDSFPDKEYLQFSP